VTRLINPTMWLGLAAAVILGVSLSSCSGPSSGSSTPEGRPLHVMLMFQQQEPGIAPYTTRMIITRRFLRIDDGPGSQDFALLDRAKKIIYSVAHSNQAILVIRNRRVTGDSPIPIAMDARRINHPDAPAIGGKQPVEYALLVNGKTCSHVVAVPGLLPDALAALREFQRVLAGQHAADLPKTPADMLDPCFVAQHIFAPVRELQYGFPIRQWDGNGKKRDLVNYDVKFKVDPTLFKLPAGFTREETGPGGVQAEPKG
jgi:hypothetical protein